MSDDVLKQGVQGISDLITTPGLVNLDFADVKTIMLDAGVAHMGIGRASGEHRAQEAARQAIHSPLLETSIEGAGGVLINVTGGKDLGLLEINEAAELVQNELHTHLDPSHVKIHSNGADWDGLIEAILGSDLADKEAIAKELETSSNREETLRKLMNKYSGIEPLLPQLRRANVTITTVKD